MKKLFAIVLLALPMAVHAQKVKPNVQVKGTLKNIKDTLSIIYANYAANGKRVVDSANVVNGQYAFNISISEPVRVQFSAKNAANKKARLTQRNVASVFIEPGIINVASVDSFTNVSVKGSKSHIEFEKLNLASKPYDSQLEVLYKQYSEFNKNKNKAAADKVEASIDSLDEKQREDVYGSYLKKNPNSPIALYALKTYAGYEILVDKVEPLFNSLSSPIKSSVSGAEFKAKIETAKLTGIGREALDFTQNDTLGVAVKLSSLRGKYLLIDFWASWCGPCRRENPNVVKVFNQYKDQGFHIIGVSLDQPNAKEKWLKAIHDDQLTWTHVSDLKYWENEVAKLYGIQAIPQNLLLDPDGKIIAKNLRGEALGKKLEAIFSKQSNVKSETQSKGK
ncbi:TlpA disulfide reductase family protein [Arcicella sp. DC2W]|uniref:TlpA disulfide reductase family protein n=1 Tax=Arcicella gelida TaxID=2984195 RepID=A0ABU5S8C3_9BACT|nr:TlpA disulfide reductase family protein [Arcicella sp. DC2W]MEA5404463.1 TlpA disulfide reductase family protein [Arcicella sp. DC2W]